MAYPENSLASLQQWTFRPSFADSWVSDALSRETEALTKALSQPLSIDTSETLATDSINNNNNNTSSFNQFMKLEQTPTISGSDPETTSKRRNNSMLKNSILKSKINKRKSRATKRSPITFITADPTNFREMVQQVTGIRIDSSNTHVPVTPLIKPEAKRLGGDLLNSYFLPTLDTSAFLLDQQLHHHHQQQQQSHQIVGSTEVSHQDHHGGSLNQSQMMKLESGVGLGLDFDFQNFPTLESWGVI